MKETVGAGMTHEPKCKETAWTGHSSFVCYSVRYHVSAFSVRPGLRRNRSLSPLVTLRFVHSLIRLEPERSERWKAEKWM